MTAKLSQVPYFVEAMRNWAMDCGFTPHLLVDTNAEGVNLPFHRIAIENGMVLLNIHQRAIDGLQTTNEWIMFEARFSRELFQVNLPVEAVISVLVPETGDKVVFRNVSVDIQKTTNNDAPQPQEQPTRQPQKRTTPQNKKGRPHLTLVE